MTALYEMLRETDTLVSFGVYLKVIAEPHFFQFEIFEGRLLLPCLYCMHQPTSHGLLNPSC